jgi:S-methylmethionine-dependent homocysteine/selenocysteine methylase
LFSKEGHMTKFYKAVLSEILDGNIIVIDGATGTELQRRGVPMRQRAWCALATESHPETLRSIHEDYIDAGARIVTANTFASTREILEPLGLGDKFVSLNRRSVELAVEARDRSSSQKPVLVAGSISHTRPARAGRWSPEHSDVAKFEADCTEMAAIHKEAGCDLILAEMMGDSDFTPCVTRAAQSNDLPIWVGLSAMQRSDGVLGTYTTEAVPFEEVLESIVATGVDVMGVMHTKAELITPALKLLKRHWSGPLMAYPDSIPTRQKESDKISLNHVLSEDIFVDHCLRWLNAGVQVLGGCCGLTISHIASLSECLRREGHYI